MSAEDKSAKADVTFALAIVKAGADRAEFSRIETALQLMFPQVSIILIAENDKPASYRRRQELSEFMKNSVCKVLPVSKINANYGHGHDWPCERRLSLIEQQRRSLHRARARGIRDTHTSLTFFKSLRAG